MAYNELDFGDEIPKQGIIDEMESLLEDDYEKLLKETVGDFGEDMDNILPDEELLSIDELFEEESELLDFSVANDMPLPETENKSTSDIFSESLSAVSSLEDELLEQQFNDLLPNVMQEQGNSEEVFGGIQNIFSEASENDRIEIKEEIKEEINNEQRNKVKEEKKRKKLEAKREKEEKKKVAKEEKKKLKMEAREKKREAKLALKEARDKLPPEKKLNKWSVGMISGLACLLLLLIILQCKTYSYDIALESAKNNMTIKRYKEAYQTLTGLELKTKDQWIYNQVETIMYVYTHKESYENYVKIKMEVEALDSLIKGVDRYYLFYDKAETIGVVDDYEELKKEFVSELKKKYELSEEDAIGLYEMEDSIEYSKKLADIVATKVPGSDNSTLVGKVIVE